MSSKQPMAASDEEAMSVPGASAVAPAVVVITRTPKDSNESRAKYADWIKRVSAIVAQQEGFINIDNYEPHTASHNFWTHVVLFTTRELLQKWRECHECKELMREVQDYTQDEDVHILRDTTQHAMMFGAHPPAHVASEKGGIETSPNARASPTPVLWKQCSVVMCCLLPNLLVLHQLLVLVGIPQSTAVSFSVKTLCTVVMGVPILTYYLVPFAMKRLGMAKWVFSHHTSAEEQFKYMGSMFLWMGIWLVWTSLWMKKGNF